MKYSFWNILNEYKIEIPIIQRDYAQGRIDKETKKIAEKFIDDLKNALIKNEPLSLDFVYGKVEANDTLILLDGQQRLTTLFLLHWYVSLKENKLTDDTKNILSKFSYETRLTSQDFCNKLVLEALSYNSNIKRISDSIRDSKWFFLSWELDPTVVSMLNMLDIIHSRFFDTKKEVYDLITNKNDMLIFFDFLPLKQFNLTDELYIKMNARGKPLTHFENFKSNFSEYLDNNNKHKLDNDWLDIFWKIERHNNKLEPENVDKNFYNFFKNITLLFYVENNDINKLFIDSYDLFDVYKNIYSDPNSNYISDLILCLETLKEYSDDYKIFGNFLKSHEKIDYWERVRFYALLQFFIKKDKNTIDKEVVYSRWLRVTNNLINNALIQSPDDFLKAVRSIKKLSEHIDDLYQYLTGDGTIDFFSEIQRKEEYLKSKLILENNEWEKLILNIEKHEFFDGQIGFLLKYSKEDNNTYSKDKFKSYSNILTHLFTSLKNNTDFLFERALLTKGDYLVNYGRNKTFCNYELGLRAKNDNWRKVFNDDHKTKYLKELLDSIAIGNIKESLEQIINNHTIVDWRKYFIENPDYIKYCSKRQLRFENGKIYLLSKEQKNGRHVELFTYDFYFKNKNNGNVIYEESYSHDEPYVIIKNNFKIIFNGRDYIIEDKTTSQKRNIASTNISIEVNKLIV